MTTDTSGWLITRDPVPPGRADTDGSRVGPSRIAPRYRPSAGPRSSHSAARGWLVGYRTSEWAEPKASPSNLTRYAGLFQNGPACGLHACLVLVLLGLPGLYAAQRGGMGQLGVAGFLTAFSGTYLIAATGNFGFLAPVLAKQAPAVLNSISQYPPVVIINGLAAILFMIGYVLFGVAMIRTATLLRWAGILVAVGAPAHLLGFGIAQLISTAAWPIPILGTASLGAGLARSASLEPV
jgi:hypothetical protein